MDLEGPLNLSGGIQPPPRKDISKLSPYLNFDPGYLPPERPEFIFLDESARTRGRMELAFSQV